jgi:predicted MFS family arabinose efflux permease
LRAGLTTLMMQQLILLGTFFVLPVYLQVVLGLDAFETGKRLFPMSVTMFIAAMLGPRLAAGLAPKRVAQAGLVALAVAAVVLLGTIDVELNRPEFGLALALFGVGAGLLLSQLGNVIMSSVDPSKTNEAGGLQGTAQNLGASRSSRGSSARSAPSRSLRCSRCGSRGACRAGPSDPRVARTSAVGMGAPSPETGAPGGTHAREGRG